jgi:hypothetical protein
VATLDLSERAALITGMAGAGAILVSFRSKQFQNFSRNRPQLRQIHYSFDIHDSAAKRAIFGRFPIKAELMKEA